MHADLVQLGFDGSYERVAAFVRNWKGERQRAQHTTDRGVFVPLVFQPGEAFQFDWSEDWAYVGGERLKLQVAHIKLSHSRAFLVRAYLLQTHEMLFDAHWHGFRVFEGVPGRGVYDNMKTAVDRIGVGKKRDVNARFLAMTSHYVFDPEFCNPAAGWEKGQVEKNVRDARHHAKGVPAARRLWQLMPAFPNLNALNEWLEERCKLLWTETPHGRLTGNIADVWDAEKAALMPLPTMFDGFVEQSKRVSPTCLIAFDRNRYSVPASFANRPVSLRIYPERLVIVAEGHVVCAHERMSALLNAHTVSQGALFMTGTIIWRWFNANPARCATGRPSLRCQKGSGSCRIICCVGQVVTARWSTSCPWCSTMTNRPCFARWKWRWMRACQQKPMY